MDCAIYRDGEREDVGTDRATLTARLATLDSDDFVWIGLNEPSPEELQEIADPLALHPLAVEDALEAHQRPKVERYSDHLFVSLRAVTYEDDDITTSEVNIFLGERYLLTVRHGGESLTGARRRAERLSEALSHGPMVALHAVVDSIVDRYEDVAAELEQDVEEVESSVFSPERTSDSIRIYRLKRETLEFRRAVVPLKDPFHRFAASATPEEARPYFRDIADHLTRAAEAIDAIEHLLDNALTAHLAQLSVQQNEDMRKLTAGATIFAVPTAIAGIYGMNFKLTSFQQWGGGFYVTTAVTLVLVGFIWRAFKRSGWI
ncbi:magnesium and cobalt transport protein CorA [Aeromicrobium sp. CF4.19]|uniref:magnesium and cobalt transport protein CorA n=1 Tax=Aeromicrobium sp. CF4.19 TaxID=3373082 RepID=UPI003EE52104